MQIIQGTQGTKVARTKHVVGVVQVLKKNGTKRQYDSFVQNTGGTDHHAGCNISSRETRATSPSAADAEQAAQALHEQG